MMNHSRHTYWMVGIAAVGAVLFLTANAGGWLVLLWPVACMATMVWMMWGMRGAGRDAPAPATRPHHDGLTHSHR
jgi:hypothetical protein